MPYKSTGGDLPIFVGLIYHCIKEFMDAQPGLGQKIARLRKAKGLTQEELVEKCNLNVRTLQRIEAGEVTPRGYTIRLIFAALGYSMEDITDADEEPGNIHSGYREVIRKISCYVLDLFNFKTNAMKKLTILSVVFLTIFMVVFSACFSARKAVKSEIALVGTWQLLKNGFPDTTYDNQPGQVRYKLITPGSFMVTDIKFGEKLMYAAFYGTITVDAKNGTYAEHMSATGGGGYARYLNNIPNTYKYKIVDSMLYTTGINNNYNEVWKKIN
jgi:transcriptional regulator with XRE-family HTH domain